MRFARLTHEQFHVLYLNIKFELIDARTEFFGHQSLVNTDIRRIVFHAITVGAVHVAFAHHHPGNSPIPSDDDIRHSNFFEETLRRLGINLLDSFVVTSREVISIKAVYQHHEEEKLQREKFEQKQRRAVKRAKIALAKVDKHATPQSSNMIIQYRSIKSENPGSLLFYRMGDFYELFFEDAIAAAEALGIVLTKHGKHEGQDIPMCGVPVERAGEYLNRLISCGHRVAVCEMMEDPEEARKRGTMIRREVVRIVTPDTITGAMPG